MISMITMLTTIITLFFFPSAYDSFIQNIEVAKKFIFHVIEKPDRTFWPTQYSKYRRLLSDNDIRY